MRKIREGLSGSVADGYIVVALSVSIMFVRAESWG